MSTSSSMAALKSAIVELVQAKGKTKQSGSMHFRTHP